MGDKVTVKFVSIGGELPSYETSGSAGMDVKAYLPKGNLVIKSGERLLVPTGLFMEIPYGYEAQMRARSGIAIKHGIGLVNGIGTIDSDYRGELLIPLINWSKEDFVIENGNRIAQMVIAPVVRCDIVKVNSLSATDRGEGGFGHTGV